MANSLQDQLLKAGLVSEEQLRDAARPNRPPRPKNQAKRRKRGGQGRTGSGRPTGTRSGAGRDSSPAPRAAAAPTRTPLEELNARIRKLLDTHRENAEEADVPYNFMREKRIKKLYVTAEQRARLLAGELSIAGYRRVHHIIPAAVADEIQSLREEIFVHRIADAAPLDPDAPADEVPDDLVW